ncbi:hypothetical protein CTI12_AA545780 [Artemisia annua]|uniref:Ankyrin repeat-containing protein n=1 Tax=Artemisia annua TaxID=35608 RepID=A0A2U1L021_ARTAN|nr:hypothetical protein CTI12_AA545780 [Artemisia annua]
MVDIRSTLIGQDSKARNPMVSNDWNDNINDPRAMIRHPEGSKTLGSHSSAQAIKALPHPRIEATRSRNVALQMVTKHPVLATNGRVLRLLACKPHHFHVLSPGIISGLLNSLFRVSHWKIRFPDKESDSDALQLLRFILKEIGKLPEDEVVAILKGPPDETKEDEKKTLYENEMQETVHLLRTISEFTAKMPAQIFSLFKNSANNNKTTALNDGNRKYSSRVLFLAAEMGNATFIHGVIRQYPHLVWELNDSSQSIFHVAVSYGHGGVYKLLNELGSSSKKIIIVMEDKDGNNMLHLVGEKVKGDRVNNVRGVGMQINPEISWFKVLVTAVVIGLAVHFQLQFGDSKWDEEAVWVVSKAESTIALAMLLQKYNVELEGSLNSVELVTDATIHTKNVMQMIDVYTKFAYEETAMPVISCRKSMRVYNLFYPIIKRVEYYSTMTNSSINNLVHLAGRLAPSFALSRATGAALQPQRGLQRREVPLIFYFIMALTGLLRALIHGGHRVLIFIQWTSMLDILEWDLDVIGVTYKRLDGRFST